MSEYRHIPDRLPETSRLIAFLEPQPVGTVVGYPEISEIIRRDAQNGGRGLIVSATKWLQNNKGHVWVSERGTGIRRLDGTEIIGKGRSSLRKVNRAVNRAAKVIGCAEYDKLSRDQKQEHDALTVGFRTIKLFSRKDGFEKVKSNLPENGAVLPDTSKILELFK